MRRVLVLVLDAASPDLIEQWTADGSLPHLRRLREAGLYGRLDSVAQWMPEATSFAFLSGRNPAATGLHCHMMWHKETMKIQAPSEDWMPFRPFWRTFAEGGPRAVVLDPANVYPPEPFNGVEINGWASHDTLAPFQTYPPALAAWIQDRFGSSLLPDEMYGLSRKLDFVAAWRRLEDVNRKFKALCLELMHREDWNLFVACNSTLHDAGHRLWNTVNVRDPLSEAEKAELNSYLRQTYVACDESIASIVQAAGKETVVMVLSLHGMGVNTSRNSIFPEMLQRVVAHRPPSHDLLHQARFAVPVEWRHAVKSRLPHRLRRELTGFWRNRNHQWTKTRAFDVLSDTRGWVRINVKGREALGIVEPGAEYNELCQEIRAGLMSFVDADTQQPVVQDVISTRDVFQGEKLADLPDLIAIWADTPAATHRAVTSPQFGLIPWPTPGQNPEGRSGNHTAQGMLIVAGPGIGSGTLGPAHILDLAPTILALLGQPMPVEMEGKPIRLSP